MTRSFFGMRSGGGSSGGSGKSVHKKVSAKERYLNKKRGIPDDTVMSKEDMYQQRIDDRMMELRAEAMKDRDGRELSKSGQVALELLAAKQAKAAAKRAAKRKSNNVEIRVGGLVGRFGGRVDKKGNVYGPDNKVCATIDLKSGKIKNNMGTSIGKYGGKNSEHIINSHIEKVYSAPSAHGSIWGSASASSIWGTSSNNDDSTGGFWG